jgi:Kef-type K+ transport system membrane component KefB
VPFFVGYYAFAAFGIEALQSILIATALTATSIAISIQVFTELGKMQSKEARLVLGAAIVDDILAIAALSVVVTMVQTGNTEPAILDITLLIMQDLGTFAAILVVSVLVIPRVLHTERLWKSRGSLEGIVTAAFFCICWNCCISRTVTHCGSLCNRYGCCKHKDYQASSRICR